MFLKLIGKKKNGKTRLTPGFNYITGMELQIFDEMY